MPGSSCLQFSAPVSIRGLRPGHCHAHCMQTPCAWLSIALVEIYSPVFFIRIPGISLPLASKLMERDLLPSLPGGVSLHRSLTSYHLVFKVPREAAL